MLSQIIQKISKRNMSLNEKEALNRQREEVLAVEVVKANQQNILANGNNLRLHRGGSVDIPQEGYGKVARSGICLRSSRNQRIYDRNQTLEDHLKSSKQYSESIVDLEGTVNTKSSPEFTR